MQPKRRMFFAVLLLAIFVPCVAVAVLSATSPEGETVVAAGDASTTTTVPRSVAFVVATTSTTVAPAPTSEAPTTTVAPTTTTTVKPTTTTVKPKPKPTTTTEAPRPKVAAPPAPVAESVDGLPFDPTPAEEGVLACLRRRESTNNYTLVSSNGLWHGAYQFAQGTWDNLARNIGRPDLVGVPAEQASPRTQDAMALALYRRAGGGPWNNAC